MPLCENFSQFWATYPLKSKPAEAETAFSSIPLESVPDLLKAVRHYADSSRSRNGHDMRADRWLESGEWRRWIDQPAVSSAGPRVLTSEEIEAKNLEASTKRKGMPWVG